MKAITKAKGHQAMEQALWWLGSMSGRSSGITASGPKYMTVANVKGESEFILEGLFPERPAKCNFFRVD